MLQDHKFLAKPKRKNKLTTTKVKMPDADSAHT